MFRAPEKAGKLCLLAAAAAAALPDNAFAEGFRNPPPGAFSLARAGGRRAQIDTPEAAYHNPANVVDLKYPSASLSPSSIYVRTKHDGAGGNAETSEPLKFLPHFFATIPIIENKLSAGLAVTSPFGIGNKWETDSGRFANPDPLTGGWRYATPYYAELITIDANPSVSWRINDHFALGAGMDIVWSQLKLKQFFPTFLLPLPGGPYPETVVRARGDAFSLGGNAGLTINLTERQRLAFTYRSPFTVEYDGSVEFKSGILPSSDFSTEIEFPTIVGAGYGIQLTDTFRLESDVEWIQFSNFGSLPIDAGSNSFLNQTVQQNWDDTFTAGIAGDWRFHPQWSYRFGYQFYQSPVPNETFSPTIPDADQNAFTTGIAFQNRHHSAEFSYGYILYDDRDINNGPTYAFNGRYETTVHLFSLQYTYSF